MNTISTQNKQYAQLCFIIVLSLFSSLIIKSYESLFLKDLFSLINLDINQEIQKITKISRLSIYVYLVSLLALGVMSDKVGRKGIIALGLGIYTITSISYLQVKTYEHFLYVHLIQMIGKAALSLIVIIILKDIYDGRKRERNMAMVKSFPFILGFFFTLLSLPSIWLEDVHNNQVLSFILAIADYTGKNAVVALSIGSFICLLYCLISFKESLQKPYQGTTLGLISKPFTLLKNLHFLSMSGLFFIILAVTALIGSPNVYIVEYSNLKITPFMVTIFACSGLGPIFYLLLSRSISTEKIISTCYILLGVCGVFTLTMAQTMPWILIVVVGLIYMISMILFVPIINLILEQQEHSTGTAVGMILAIGFLLKIFFPQLIPYKEALTNSVGSVLLAAGIVGFFSWNLLKKRPFVTLALERLSK